MTTTELRIASIMHNVRELRIQTAMHIGESTGNLDMLERRIEDGIRELAGLAPVQPELPLDGELLRACHLSGQMSAAQSVTHAVAGELPSGVLESGHQTFSRSDADGGSGPSKE